MKCSECGVTFAYTLKGWRKEPRLCPDCNGNPQVIWKVEMEELFPRKTLEEVRAHQQERHEFLERFFKEWGWGHRGVTPIQMDFSLHEARRSKKWTPPPGHMGCGREILTGEPCYHRVGHGRHELYGPSFRRYMCECGAHFPTRRQLERHLKNAYKHWKKFSRRIKPIPEQPELEAMTLDQYGRPVEETGPVDHPMVEVGSQSMASTSVLAGI